jgi:hypothetical protein
MSILTLSHMRRRFVREGYLGSLITRICLVDRDGVQNLLRVIFPDRA